MANINYNNVIWTHTSFAKPKKHLINIYKNCKNDKH